MTPRNMVWIWVLALGACAGPNADVQRTTLEAPSDEAKTQDEAEARRAELEAKVMENSALLQALASEDAPATDVFMSGDSVAELVVGDGSNGSGLAAGNVGIGSLDPSATRAGTAGRATFQVSVTVAHTHGVGTQDPTGVTRAVRKHQRAIQYCFDKAKAKAPDTTPDAQGGTFTVRVGADGRVTKTSAGQNTLTSDVQTCIERRLRRMVFPPSPKDDTILTVTLEAERNTP